mmetsp:Transcript_16309/g.29662  ORF Transcript_16309/g.29662 Transcript_16309/m.29662 type:complete len:570 (+) Transcript_16309:84-1793(+)
MPDALRQIGRWSSEWHVSEATRRLTLNETELIAHCAARTNCGDCTSQYPSCAWCASSSACMVATQQLQQTVDNSEDVAPVYYHKDEYQSTYGGSANGYMVEDGQCKAWVKHSDTCRALEGYCSREGSVHCGDCLRVQGCGMCVHGNEATCRSGSGSTAFGFTNGGSLCDAPGESWIFGDWINNRSSESQCQVEKCTDQDRVLSEAIGSVGLGNRLQGLFYEGGTNCSWVLWPGYGNRSGDQSRIIPSIQALTGYARGPNDYLEARIWAGDGPIHGFVPENPNDWPRGQMLARIGVGMARSMEIRSYDPVILDFVSVPGSQRAALEITWQDGDVLQNAEQDAGKSLASVAMTWWLLALAFGSVMGALAGVMMLRKMLMRRVEAERLRAAAAANRHISMEDIVQQIPSLAPKVIKQADLDKKGGANNTCSVCLGDVAVGERVRLLPCDHFFHVGCIDTWLERSQACPLCRNPLNIDESKLPNRPRLPSAPEGHDREAQQEVAAVQTDENEAEGTEMSVAPVVIGAQQQQSPRQGEEEPSIPPIGTRGVDIVINQEEAPASPASSQRIAWEV